MSTYNSIAYHRLNHTGDPKDVDKGVVEFMQQLCELEEDLLEFEAEVSKEPIDLTGVRATRRLDTLEERHSKFQEEIRQAHHAIVMKSPFRLERNPAKDSTRRTQEAIYDFQADFLEVVGRLEDISSRIARRVDGKRNSANTRLVFSVSVIAAGISMAALTSQLLSALPV